MINILVVAILGVFVLPAIWAFFNPGWMEDIMDGKRNESFSHAIRRIVGMIRVIKNYIVKSIAYTKRRLFTRSPGPRKV